MTRAHIEVRDHHRDKEAAAGAGITRDAERISMMRALDRVRRVHSSARIQHDDLVRGGDVLWYLRRVSSPTRASTQGSAWLTYPVVVEVGAKKARMPTLNDQCAQEPETPHQFGWRGGMTWLTDTVAVSVEEARPAMHVS